MNTTPDPAELWRMLHSISTVARGRVKWRIPSHDWDHIRRDWGISNGVGVPFDRDRPWTLYGRPVEVVDGDTLAWPELVIVCDRRLAVRP